MRGEGETLIVYADLGCPHCAAAWPELASRPSPVVFRHFPLAGKRPRAPALHAAAEAAGRRAASSRWSTRSTPTGAGSTTRISGSGSRALGLDLERFEADRRSDAVAARVRRDFESGIRAGVTATPALFGALSSPNRIIAANPECCRHVLSLAKENESSESDGRHPGGRR